jgi:hypothetical protein
MTMTRCRPSNAQEERQAYEIEIRQAVIYFGQILDQVVVSERSNGFKFLSMPSPFLPRRKCSLAIITGLLDQFHQPLQIDTLWSLDGHAQSTIPDKLGQRSQASAHTEGDSVVQRIFEAVVMEQHT